MLAAVLYNADWEGYAPGAPSLEADAEIAEIARLVAAALVRQGQPAVVHPVKDDTAALIGELRARGAERVFNLVESLGGDAGREPEIPELLEAAGLPYTGNRPAALRVAQDKDRARAALLAAGVPIPAGLRVEPGHTPSAAELAAAGLQFPLFVKPARTDASIGVDRASITRSPEELARKLSSLGAQVAGPSLIETYLPGREINVALFPEPARGYRVSTFIDFSLCDRDVPPIVTYDCKWRPGTPEYNARSLPCAGRVPPAEITQAEELARRAFLAIGGTSYGRVDLRAGEDGRYHVIDVNPNPDLHPEAGLSIAAASVGVDHDALVRAIAQVGWEVAA